MNRKLTVVIALALLGMSFSANAQFRDRVKAAKEAVVNLAEAERPAEVEPPEPEPEPEVTVEKEIADFEVARPIPHPCPCPPEPIRRNYVVASPRAALTARPDVADALTVPEADVCCSTQGAAHNFKLNHGRMVVRQNTHIRFKLASDIEGVWYEKACGILGTFIQLEIWDEDNQVWRKLGADSRAARFCGPGIGTARNIGNTFRANRPGTYLLRNHVITYALPLRADLQEPADLRSLLTCGDVDIDVVYTKIKVVGYADPTAADRAWEAVEADAEEAEAIELEDMGGVNLLE